MEAIRESQRAQGTAAILAIGTASPDNCIYQADMPDFYFRVTNSQHMTDLKDKFKRMCEKSGIRKRHFFLNEETLRQNQNMCVYKAPSLDARQEMLVEAVPKLGMVAAEKAIKEWGHPVSAITHLIFYTTSGLDMPGADFRLSRLLGLGPHVSRLMLYNNGCYSGGTLLRLAKDLAENTLGARVLAVAVENSVVSFHGPSLDHLDILLGQALFGDGAAALVVGSDADTNTERPLFYLAAALQRTIPGSEGDLRGRVCEMGLSYYISYRVPELISANVERFVEEAFGLIGVEIGGRLNSLFYAVHPGGKAILDKIEESLGLCPDKLAATRRVMREYGNMWSPCVLFILDEIARKSAEEGRSTTGEGLQWGVVLGLGPGLTVETVVVHSAPTL